MVNRFILAFTKNPAVCSWATDFFPDVTLSYFIIYDSTIFIMGCQGKTSRKEHCITAIQMGFIGAQCAP